MDIVLTLMVGGIIGSFLGFWIAGLIGLDASGPIVRCAIVVPAPRS